MRKVDVSKLPVMAAHCKTCPFKMVDGRWQDVELANTVTQRTLFKGHQICHGTEGPGRKANNRCKGSFDNNMEIYQRMGCAHLVK
jgi:hypothetical protein